MTHFDYNMENFHLTVSITLVLAILDHWNNSDFGGSESKIKTININYQ